MDGQTDKNRQMIAVTLHLRFVATLVLHFRMYISIIMHYGSQKVLSSNLGWILHGIFSRINTSLISSLLNMQNYATLHIY